jgi:hypothetical protein
MTASVALLRLPPLDFVPEPLRGKLTVSVRIAYLGTEADGARLVEPMREMGPAVIDTVADMPYRQVGTIHGDPPVPLPIHEGSIRLDELTEAAVDDLAFGRESTPEHTRGIFGEDVHDRLSRIKRAYDAEYVFRLSHNIPPVQ